MRLELVTETGTTELYRLNGPEHVAEQPPDPHRQDPRWNPEPDPVVEPHRRRPRRLGGERRERGGAVHAPANGEHGQECAQRLHAGAEGEVPGDEDRVV